MFQTHASEPRTERLLLRVKQSSLRSREGGLALLDICCMTGVVLKNALNHRNAHCVLRFRCPARLRRTIEGVSRMSCMTAFRSTNDTWGNPTDMIPMSWVLAVQGTILNTNASEPNPPQNAQDSKISRSAREINAPYMHNAYIHTYIHT